MTTWPETLNAYEFFLGDRIHDDDGDRIAIRLDEATLTYSDVAALVNGYATALADAGVSKGDRVLIVMPDTPGFVAVFLATIRLGAVAVMLNPSLTPAAMGAIVDRSRAAVALVAPIHRESFEASLMDWKPGIVDPDNVGPAPEGPATVATKPDDQAMWLFSGGTTGLPKAVPQTHKSLVNTTRLYGQGSLGLGPDDITMAVPKLYFGYATGSNFLFPFSVGGSIVLFEEHPTPDALFERIDKHHPTVLVNVPSAINQMLAAPGVAGHDLSSLRLATSAGEALPDTLYHRWVDTFGVELLDGLGTAEMWHVFVTNTVGDVKPGTLGRVVPGYTIKVCDEDGEEVPTGEVGRLWVRGDSLGLGYVDDPEQTGEAFRGDWFASSDLVSIDDDGYVTHRGRADDAIKVKGKWFRPQEVESTLLDHPTVADCAVVAVEDEAGLSRPVAFVVPAGDVSEQELIDWVLEHLEAYKHPRRVFLVDTLPKTHLGKVDRAELKRKAT